MTQRRGNKSKDTEVKEIHPKNTEHGLIDNESDEDIKVL
jgi:hypothetical protein